MKFIIEHRPMTYEQPDERKEVVYKTTIEVDLTLSELDTGMKSVYPEIRQLTMNIVAFLSRELK